MWIKAYRTEVPHANMKTTNMIESWHKRLKYDNFEGKFNRCSDLLIYELYVVIDSDTQHQRRLADVQAGRMMPAEQEIRRRKLKAQALADTVLEFETGRHYWTVASETTQDIRYSVEKRFEHNQLERQFYCACEDFQMRQLPCKHIYAVIIRYFSSSQQCQQLLLSTVQQPPPRQQPTADELRQKIQEMVININDLDITSLQIVHNQLSRILDEVHRPDRDFQTGDWASESQRIGLPPHMSIERQRR